MNKASLWCLAVAFYWCEGFAQTNCPVPRTLFSLPHLELKKLECEPGVPLQAQRTETPERGPDGKAFEAPALSVTVSTNSSNPAPVEIALSSAPKDDFFQKLDIYRRLDEGGYLTRHDSRSDSLIERSIDSTFRPELLHVGKTTMSCSLITAFKRKNPFCLLNPCFFQLSW
jgi:hypothetical protein